jgi:hypothetical protein
VTNARPVRESVRVAPATHLTHRPSVRTTRPSDNTAFPALGRRSGATPEDQRSGMGEGSMISTAVGHGAGVAGSAIRSPPTATWPAARWVSKASREMPADRKRSSTVTTPSPGSTTPASLTLYTDKNGLPAAARPGETGFKPEPRTVIVAEPTTEPKSVDADPSPPPSPPRPSSPPKIILLRRTRPFPFNSSAAA